MRNFILTTLLTSSALLLFGCKPVAQALVENKNPATVPGAPTSVSGTSGNASVDLTWTAPSSNGGSAITDYSIEYSSNSGSTWSSFSDGTSSSTSATVTGLTNGTAYVFRVAAVNAVGTGSFSSASSSVTPAPTAPGTPTGVLGVAGNTQVNLFWTAPVSDGGSAITDNEIQYSSNGGTSWTSFVDVGFTVSPTAVTGLTNGTAYVFRVRAVNAIGTGSYSSASSSVTPVTTPGAPTAVSGTSANTSVNLIWTAPASTGGSPITDYQIQHSTDGTTWTTFTDTVSTSTSVTVTGLTNLTAYTFRVAAINAVGTGSFSTPSGSVTPAPTAPGTPTGVSGTAGNTLVNLSWTAPASDGGSAITDYEIQHSTDGTTWTDFSDAVSTSTTASVTGLVNGTPYMFRVRAVNAIGTGSYSTPSGNITPSAATAPGAPTGVAGVSGTPFSVVVSWSAPASDGGSAITDYQIQHSTDGTTWTTFSDAVSATTSATVTGLTNGTAYMFRVAAINAIGTSSYSSNSPSATPACPTGYVNVARNDDLWTTAFCVAKYEMKDVSGIATSQSAEIPLTAVTRGMAIGECSGLGANYDLITNVQWQALAREIETAQSPPGFYLNWSNNSTTGNNAINRGHSDHSPAGSLAAAADNSPCTGTGNTNCATNGHSDFSQKRTHTLKSGEIIWDVGGNVAEWVKDDNISVQAPDGYISLETSWDATDKLKWGPQGTYTSKNSGEYGGFGYGFLNYNNGAIVRGGSWLVDPNEGITSTEMNGLFTAFLNVDTNDAFVDIVGFRCVINP